MAERKGQQCLSASDYRAVAMGFLEPARKKPEHTLPAD